MQDYCVSPVDMSSIVCTLINRGKLANQIAVLLPIVLKKDLTQFRNSDTDFLRYCKSELTASKLLTNSEYINALDNKYDDNIPKLPLHEHP